MARPVKDGLDYFPKNTGFYHDPKIRALIGRFGCDGAVLYDYILCEAYGRNGYYAEMDEFSIDIIAADLKMSPEKIGLILDYLLNKSMLLDGTLFKAVKVLTSHGIQARYQEAVRGRAKKRGISVDGELWLLKEAETEGFIQVRLNDNFSGKNSDKSRKNEYKSPEESPKESKGKEIKVNTPPTPPGGRRAVSSPSYHPDWFERFWKLYPRKTNRVQAVKAWDKLKPDLALCKVMDSAIRAQMRTEQWQDSQHIPHPSTWLNGERWNDEICGGGHPDGEPPRRVGRLTVDENGEEVVQFD